MEHRRKSPRLKVNLPIHCQMLGRGANGKITSSGLVQDLSSWGMRISVPVPLRALGSAAVDYALHLPKPFNRITGNGRIRWAYWDEQLQQTTFGMEISPLDRNYQKDIDTILDELSEEIATV